MRLTISNSEWKVLSSLLYNSGLNSFNVSDIINKHKQILAKYKDKLLLERDKELNKYKRALEKKKAKNAELQILKFESELDETTDKKFKDKFYKIAQEIEGSI